MLGVLRRAGIVLIVLVTAIILTIQFGQIERALDQFQQHQVSIRDTRNT